MYKQKFISTLKRRLSGLPRQEISERVNFYSEMIDDRIEEGLSEREAVAAVGSIDSIVAQVRNENPRRSSGVSVLGRSLRGWEIAVIIIGSPVWLPLLLAAAAIIFSLYAVMWSLIAVLWVLEIPFFIMGFISKYLLVGCAQSTRSALYLTKKGASIIRRRKNG